MGDIFIDYITVYKGTCRGVVTSHMRDCNSTVSILFRALDYCLSSISKKGKGKDSRINKVIDSAHIPHYLPLENRW